MKVREILKICVIPRYENTQTQTQKVKNKNNPKPFRDWLKYDDLKIMDSLIDWFWLYINLSPVTSNFNAMELHSLRIYNYVFFCLLKVLHTVLCYQVFLSNSNNSYDFKYSYLIRIIISKSFLFNDCNSFAHSNMCCILTLSRVVN